MFKKLILVASVLALLAGCSMVSVEYKGVKASSVRFFVDQDLKGLKIVAPGVEVSLDERSENAETEVLGDIISKGVAAYTAGGR